MKVYDVVRRCLKKKALFILASMFYFVCVAYLLWHHFRKTLSTGSRGVL